MTSRALETTSRHHKSVGWVEVACLGINKAFNPARAGLAEVSTSLGWWSNPINNCLLVRGWADPSWASGSSSKSSRNSIFKQETVYSYQW